MRKLTQDYVENHLGNIYTYESFGRSICESIFKEAINKLNNQNTEKIQLTADISVSPTNISCMYVEIQGRRIHIPRGES